MNTYPSPPGAYPPDPPQSLRRDPDGTRASLVAAARSLFIVNGYAETSTPSIAAQAGATRGALYHHFSDKAALFSAVLMVEALDVATQVEQACAGVQDPVDALDRAAAAYFEAMATPGRARLLSVEAPAALARDEHEKIHTIAFGGIAHWLQQASEQGRLIRAPVGPLSVLLSVALNRAALEISERAMDSNYRAAAGALLAAVLWLRE